MKRLFILTTSFLILFGNIVFAQYDITFETRSDMNYGRHAFGETRQGNLIYVFNGGYESNSETSAEIYDSSADEWTMFATDLIPRDHSTAAYVYPYVYIIGGYSSPYSTFCDTVEVLNAVTGSMHYAKPMPYPVDYCGSAIWKNQIYIFGGENNDGYSNRLYKFDAIKDDWIRLADMPESKTATAGWIVNGILYVFGGYNGSGFASIHSYEISTDTWNYIGDLPVSVSSHAVTGYDNLIWIVGDYTNQQTLMSFNVENYEVNQYTNNMTPRRHAGAMIIEKQLIVFGGNQVSEGPALKNTESANLESFYPNDVWFNSLADMENGRYGLASATDGEYFYSICGGISSSPWRLGNIEKYDPATDTWSEFVTGLIPRRYCNAEFVPSQNKIYIFNGDTYTGSTYSDSVEIVDVTSGEISYSGNHPFPVEYGGSAMWDDKIYIFGGGNFEGYSNRLYEFDLATLSWTQLADMPEAKQTNGEVANGVLYVFGGYTGSVSTRIDAYDIATNSWSFKGNMPVGISAHITAVIGPYIFLVGSYNNLESLAVYDTDSDEFTILQSNMTGRRHAAAEIFGNYLYICGGNQSSGGDPLASFEYAEITDYFTGVQKETKPKTANFALAQNYPNPFNSKTTIRFELFCKSNVTIDVYNTMGEVVASLLSKELGKGSHQINWDGKDLPSGIYYYRLRAASMSQTKKLVLLR